jgi:SAM-dependent methyltransferase
MPDFFSDQDAKAVIQRYSSRLEKHGHSHLSVGWGPKNRQYARFEVLASEWDLQGKSVLDVGSGFGDFFDWLGPNWSGSYTGVDLVPGLVEMGREIYGDRTNFELLEGNFLDMDLVKKFDLVVISGLFNFKLADGNNLGFIQRVLEKSKSVSREGLSANFITDRVDYQEDLIFYSSESDILKIAFSLTRRAKLRADYFPFEFSIFLHWDEEFEPESAVFKSFGAAS